MQPQRTEIGRAWFSICWFATWGLFQGFAVFSVLNGTWERPAAFPAGAYESLIYPDMFFIPLYLLAATLLFRRHWLGSVGLCGGRWNRLRHDLSLGPFWFLRRG